jgi:hypothetical protein
MIKVTYSRSGKKVNANCVVSAYALAAMLIALALMVGYSGDQLAGLMKVLIASAK